MSEPVLVKGCLLWDKITEKMNDGKYTIPEPLRSQKLEGDSAYQYYDYDALGCRIVQKVAEVRVGDAVNHKTKIDLNRRILEYYDPDIPTALGVADLLRSIGLKCAVTRRVTRCTGVTKRRVATIFKALAMVPSMDRRMEYCREKHSADECRKMELTFFRKTAKREK